MNIDNYILVLNNQIFFGVLSIIITISLLIFILFKKNHFKSVAIIANTIILSFFYIPIFLIFYLSSLPMSVLLYVTLVYFYLSLGILLSIGFLREKLNNKTELFKFLYSTYNIVSNLFLIVFTLLSIPFLAQYLSIKYKSNDIKAETWMSFYATFFGIIASISGIYWQVTRTERKEKKDKQEKNNNELQNTLNLFRYILKKNKEKFEGKFTSNGFIQLYYSRIKNIESQYFYLLDEEIIKQDYKLILSEENNYCLIELQNELKIFNNLLKSFQSEMNIERVKDIVLKCGLANKRYKIYCDLIANEFDIIEMLIKSDSRINEKRLIMSKELLNNCCKETNMYLEEKYLKNINESLDTNNKCENVSERIIFLQEVQFFLRDMNILNQEDNVFLMLNNLISNYGTNLFKMYSAIERIIERFNEVEEVLNRKLNKQ
jgi:hypothetical protein